MPNYVLHIADLGGGHGGSTAANPRSLVELRCPAHGAHVRKVRGLPLPPQLRIAMDLRQAAGAAGT
jgi:hypothetical protein